MRLFRQGKLGEWRPVFERICQEVIALQQAITVNTILWQDAADEHLHVQAASEKVVSWTTLLRRRTDARLAKKKVVWTNGCFDLMHIGHARSLQAARDLGDMLIVGVNSDASVKRRKGPTRPIIPEAQRAEMLASLACVDYVIIFDEDTPAEAIARLRPDIHCKGADYAPPSGKPIPEVKVVEDYGGRIEFLPLVEGISTSGLCYALAFCNALQPRDTH
jgi:rfaE bifunctional protein nucleotidyltransferase chain/domain